MKFFPIVFLILLVIGCSKNSTPPDNSNPVDTTQPNPPDTSVPAPPNTDTLASGWTKITLPDSSIMLDIFFSDNQLGYAISDSDTYKSTDGGISWTKDKYDINNSLYSNLSVTQNGNVFITASNGNYIFESLNGENFVGKPIVNIGQGADVFFTDNDTGYISCAYRGGSAGLWKTVDGGNSWSLVPLTNYSPNQQSYLSFNQFVGYCTGANIHYKSVADLDWHISSVSSSDFFISINAVNDKVAYTIGSSGYLYNTVNGGKSFTKMNAFFNPREGFTDIAFVDTQTGYITNGKRLYKTRDGGKTWNPEIGLHNNFLVEVHFTDAQHGWACGGRGEIFVYRKK